MNELFIILSKCVSKNMYDKYSKTLKGKNIIFISDKTPLIQKNNIFHYEDQELKIRDFKNLHSKIEISSWDKSFYHIVKTNTNYDYYWFIEDDCYVNDNNSVFFKKCETIKCDLLVFGWYKEFKKDYWNRWKNAKTNYFDKNVLASSINQIARLSKQLIQEILLVKETLNRFVFHEIMFASTAKKQKLKIVFYKNTSIHLSALHQNSILYKKYKNKLNKNTMNDIQKKYMLVHPLKWWYNVL